MWDVRACRSCLTVKCKLEKIGEASKRLYTVLTGLQIKDGDGYPNYFCVECRAQLRKCLAFRRKSRRAHFVLKEIMTVRKQVTFSDIITVNRRKTNLESPLNFWDPQKTSSYLIINADEQDSVTKVKPTGLTYGSNYTHIVDIKPDIIVKTEEDDIPAENTDDIAEDNSTPDQIDEPKEEAPADIDLNDIFKDLKNDNDSSENEIEDKNDVKSKDEKEVKHMLDKRLPLKATVNAVAACKIRVLSLEEQMKKIEFRQKQEPFYHAQYKCSMCFTTYKTMEQLVEHVNFHNERRFAHECQVCKNNFETVDDLNIHAARTHMYEYTCKCHAVYYSMYDIVTHYRRCSPNLTRRKAVLTWTKMFKKSILTEEMRWQIAAFRTADKEKQEFKPSSRTDIQCELCGVWVQSVAAMDSHTRHTHPFCYTCRLCKEVFSQRSLSLKHANTHIQKRVYPCKICGTQYKSRMSLCAHRSRKHSTQMPCNLCGRSFHSPWTLYKHQLADHKYISVNDPLLGDPQHQCADCKAQFADRAALALHLVVEEHAGAADVPFSCIPCKKVYKCAEELETHLITCSQPVKYPRKCCYCEEMLHDKVQYKRHYNREHPTLQYRYAGMNTICESCGKSIFKPHLEAHLKSHQESAFECRTCGAASLDPTVHVNHVLSQHAARPYCCTLCTRRFQHRSDCRDHILKVHAPAKLYRCEFCGLEFSYFRRLKNHSEKLHNVVLSPYRNPKASKLKIFVYAHMIIEINVLEKEAVEKSEVELQDYLGHKSKPVNYEKFFRFHTLPDEIMIKKRKRKPRPKIPKQCNVKIESDIVIKREGEELIDGDFQAKREPVARVEVELLGNEVGISVKEIQPQMEDEVVEEMVEESTEQVVLYQDPVEEVMFDQEPEEHVLFDEEQVVFDQEPIEQVVFDQEPIEQVVFDQEPIEQVVFDQEPVEQVVFDQELVEHEVFHEEPVEQKMGHKKSVEQKVFRQEPVKQKVFHQKPVKQKMFHQEPVEQMLFHQKPLEQKLSHKKPGKQKMFHQEPVEQMVFHQKPMKQVFQQGSVKQEVFHQKPVKQVFHQEPVQQKVFLQETVKPKVFHQGSVKQKVFHQKPVKQVFHQEPVQQKVFLQETVKPKVFHQGSVKQEVFHQKPVKQVFHQEPVQQKVFLQETVKPKVFHQGSVKQKVFRQEPVEQMVFDQTLVDHKVSHKKQVKQKVIHQEPVEQMVFHQEPVEQMVFDEEPVEQDQEFVNKLGVDQDLGQQVVEQEPVQQPMEVEDAPLEVFEMDGQQYVMICGEMYKIAGEDDE